MSRVVLYITVATVSFIVGVAANWNVNTFGGFAVDKIYVDPSMPSLLQAKSGKGGMRNKGPVGCRQ